MEVKETERKSPPLLLSVRTAWKETERPTSTATVDSTISALAGSLKRRARKGEGLDEGVA